jgi:hypothetical protein
VALVLTLAGRGEIIRSLQTVRKDFSPASAAILLSFRALRKGGFMAKQTKITIETDSMLILRGRSCLRAWCDRCAVEVEMVALENMGVISNLEQPELEQWLGSGDMHRLQAADGSALICLNSLLARIQNTTTIQPGGVAKHSKETK